MPRRRAVTLLQVIASPRNLALVLAVLMYTTSAASAHAFVYSVFVCLVVDL
jgi:hypothetical protein